MLDRSAILRTAHGQARYWMAQDSKRLSRGRRWRSYRDAFRYALRLEWGSAKERVRQAAEDAELARLEEAEAAAAQGAVAAGIDALRRFAETMPLTLDGRERRRTLLIEADDLAMAARAMMIPAPEPAHHAH